MLPRPPLPSSLSLFLSSHGKPPHATPTILRDGHVCVTRRRRMAWREKGDEPDGLIIETQPPIFSRWCSSY